MARGRPGTRTPFRGGFRDVPVMGHGKTSEFRVQSHVRGPVSRDFHFFTTLRKRPESNPNRDTPTRSVLADLFGLRWEEAWTYHRRRRRTRNANASLRRNRERASGSAALYGVPRGIGE